jgi:hypothetical protein
MLNHGFTAPPPSTNAPPRNATYVVVAALAPNAASALARASRAPSYVIPKNRAPRARRTAPPRPPVAPLDTTVAPTASSMSDPAIAIACVFVTRRIDPPRRRSSSSSSPRAPSLTRVDVDAGSARAALGNNNVARSFARARGVIVATTSSVGVSRARAEHGNGVGRAIKTHEPIP